MSTTGPEQSARCSACAPAYRAWRFPQSPLELEPGSAFGRYPRVPYLYPIFCFDFALCVL